MTQGLGSERSPVARIPRVAVESDGRGVAGQTHVRRWPRTTRCNELAVIVMRDGELVGRESLIAAVRLDKREKSYGKFQSECSHCHATVDRCVLASPRQ
jgi:hypothetical protein